MATIVFEGSTFDEENPYIISYATYVYARRRAMQKEEPNQIEPSPEWERLNACANRALHKALEWEDQKTAFGAKTWRP